MKSLREVLSLAVGLALVSLSSCGPAVTEEATTASDETDGAPIFKVDPFWPKPLPNDWLIGEVGGLAVDSRDHIWIIQRPGSLSEDELGATQDPPRSICCQPAPPVMEFDVQGNFIQGWGGSGEGYE